PLLYLEFEAYLLLLASLEFKFFRPLVFLDEYIPSFPEGERYQQHLEHATYHKPLIIYTQIPRREPHIAERNRHGGEQQRDPRQQIVQGRPELAIEAVCGGYQDNDAVGEREQVQVHVGDLTHKE